MARTSGEGSREQSLCLRCERSVARVADGDQDIAHKAVAADALDWRFAEQRTKPRLIQPRQLGQTRGVNSSRG